MTKQAVKENAKLLMSRPKRSKKLPKILINKNEKIK